MALTIPHPLLDTQLRDSMVNCIAALMDIFLRISSEEKSPIHPQELHRIGQGQLRLAGRGILLLLEKKSTIGEPKAFKTIR